MAYLRKEVKAELVKAVKEVLPKGWKATFALRNYSTLVCTVRSAPLDLEKTFGTENGYYRVNPYYRAANFHGNEICKDAEVGKVLEKILDAMNGKNYDNSDPMTDYFDVGYYVELNFGDYDKPFVNK